MPITLYGVDPSITEEKWARLWHIAGKGSYHHCLKLPPAYAPSVASGTRLVSVAAGQASVVGVFADSTAALTVTLDGNTGTNPRIDTVVLKIDWASTAALGGTIAVVKGSNAATPVPPALTQDPGVLWHMPIAHVTVRPGIGQLDVADLADARPTQREEKIYKATPELLTSPSQATVPTVLASIAVTDPGWPYRIEATAQVLFAPVNGGRGTIDVTIDGTVLSEGRAPDLNAGPAHLYPEVSAFRSGPATVQLRMLPNGLPGGQGNLIVQSGWRGFTVRVIPQ